MSIILSEDEQRDLMKNATFIFSILRIKHAISTKIINEFKSEIIKQLLEKVCNHGQLFEFDVFVLIKILRDNGIDWSELATIEKSLRADGYYPGQFDNTYKAI